MKQLIFDCDGVLVDTEIVAAKVMTELLQSYGIDIDTKDYIQKFTGKTFTTIFESFNLDPKRDIQEIAKSIEQKIYANLREIPGMSDLLLAQHLPVSIVSNSATWQVKKALQFLGIEKRIGSSYFSSEMVPRPKPYPDIYLKAAEYHDVVPGECLVIEDSISGATAALTAGMPVIGFCGASHIQTDHAEKLYEIGVSRVAFDAAELESAIQELS
ncbi:MAG: HAD family phosphatase [Bacteroidota bacterium]